MAKSTNIKLLALADDFGTVDWAAVYPYPTLALKELEELLAF